jgi:EAL domain-containing protein (putative c-di-GMP-specific phosphodiesterase class I)/DNA-binding response OmpR family regulator
LSESSPAGGDTTPIGCTLTGSGEEGDGDQVTRPAVLVIDDEPGGSSTTLHVLAQGGYDVLESSDARQALDLLSQRRFAAVVIDMHLPGMAGIELIERIRAESSSATVPILVVTTDSTVGDRIRGLAAGATDCVSKPFNSQELLARVTAQVRWHHSWARLMEVQLRERSELETALWQLNPEATPELTAELVCEQLRRVRHINAAAILAFPSAGGGIPLAVHELPMWDLQVGRQLAPDLSLYLRHMAAAGPWIERREHRAVRVGAHDSKDAPGMVACAPLLRDQLLLGLLILTTDVPGGEAKAGGRFRAMSAAIDFADIAAGLLGPGLDERTRFVSQRAIIDDVLTQGTFHPIFEPIVRLTDGQVTGYEALTRFDDGTAPEARFAMAASINRRLDLEHATLRAAIDASVVLPEGCFISLNVSPELVLDVDALRDLLWRLDRPVVLELTEHDPIDDYGAVRRAVVSLGDSVRLSIDDAGSGFASLQHVLALEPDFVKLDKTWVIGINDDPTRQALIAGLSHFAAQTGCHLIAEGIETVLDLDVLRGLDVELGQGYLFGRAGDDEVTIDLDALTTSS